MNTGIKKMFRDLTLYKGRTLLTLAGILIGLISVGAVLSAYATLSREMNENFMRTNPSSFILDVENLDPQAVLLLEEIVGDLDIELRTTLQARVSRGDGTYGTIFLKAVADFKNLKVDTFTLEQGSFPVTDSEMVIERDCLKLLNNLTNGVGEEITIKVPGGLERQMLLSGRVHAPGLPPASMENFSYAFLTLEGLNKLGYKGWYRELHIVSYDQRFDFKKMKTLSMVVKKTLTEHGYIVNKVDVPVPGRHPHAAQLDSLLFLLQTFAVISLLAACLIIINLLNFIMSKQTKQIAVMKAVGASTFDIAVPYFIYVILISLVAIVLSIPLAIIASKGYSSFAAGILNFNILDSSIPIWVFITQVLIGILIPLGAAAYPIYKSCKISVKDGLSEQVNGTVDGQKKSMLFQKAILFKTSKIKIPINNLLRKRTRTILAISALIAGGVLFMTSRNIVASINKTVTGTFESFGWDYDIQLAGNYPENKINEVLASIDGLELTEIWKGATILLRKDNYSDSAYYQVRITPENSQIANLDFPNNLETNGHNAIIITNGLIEDEPWLQTGTTLQASINGQVADIFVSGIVKEVPPIPALYMNTVTFESVFPGKYKQMIFARANTSDFNKQRVILKTIEAKFKAAGIELSDNLNIYVLRKAFIDHLYVIITFLTAIAMLAVLVGGLSIGSAIGINVAERRREMGVLRAIGVNRFQMISMTLLEVLVMSMIGWFSAVLISYPVSIWVGNYFGQIFLSTNLDNTLSLAGSIQWLVISVLISLIAGLLPAWKATKSNLTEMLSYE